MERPIIVIAEDEILVRLTLVCELEQDYEVIEARDGSEAIQSITTYRERIHAILTDIHMPDVDGWAVLAFAVEQQLPCRLIVMSADAIEHDARWQQYPQARFFPKPTDTTAMKQCLAQAHAEARL